MTKPTDTMQQLHLGIDAARNGQVDLAREQLTAVIIQEPENIPALLWLAFIATDPQESIDYLMRVLALEPDHERALSGVQWAKARLAQQATNEQTESSEEGELSEDDESLEDDELPNLRQQLFADASHKKGGRKSMLAHRARRTINPFLVLLLTLTGLTGLIYFNTGWLPLALAHNNQLALPHNNQLALAHNDTSIQFTTVTIAGIPFEQLSTQAESSQPLINQPHQISPKMAYSPSSTVSNIAESQMARERKTDLSATTTEIGPFILRKPVDTALLAHQPDYPDQKWIEVDIANQYVIAWEGNVPVMQFVASTGIDDTPTVIGKFNIYWKLESTVMTGPDYYLPEVPYTMYFYRDYGIHGTYWHDNFGQPMSHGCVNLHTDNARQLFEWAGPAVPAYQTEVTSSWYNPGTLVVIHE